MHRSVSRRLAILVLVGCMALPASAAPRRDDSTPGFFEKIVRVVKRLLPLIPLDTIDASVPKP
jgi:hypothetical protein